MRNDDEFKSEIYKRCKEYKIKRNQRIKNINLVLCLLCIIPVSSLMINPMSAKKESNDRHKMEESNLMRITIKKESNILKVKNKLNKYNWQNEEIKLGEIDFVIQLEDNMVIEIIENRIMFDNKWVLLDKEEIEIFKEFINEIMEDES